MTSAADPAELFIDGKQVRETLACGNRVDHLFFVGKLQYEVIVVIYEVEQLGFEELKPIQLQPVSDH
ncbi:hypothetical protein [Pelagerythrobacter aerophilus]